MLRLMLLRHAKSDWPTGTADLDRPLARRGREAAPRMGAYLAAEGLLPDLVLVSPARRAQETYDLVAPSLGGAPMRVEPRIYEAPPERLLAVVREVEARVRALLLIGHNPGFEELSRTLVGHGDRYALARLSEKYPTAGLAAIDFAVEAWSAVAPRAGRLDRFVTPKSIGAGEDE